MAKTVVFAAAIAAFFLVQPNAGAAQQSGASTQDSAPPLKIGSGDLIEVSVYDSPDLSAHFRVDEKGNIAVPLLGLVHVEGETALEAGASIEKRYVDADILKPSSAGVTVFITEYASQGITVAGEVRTAGLVPALGVRMFNDVMNAAGGVTQLAASKAIITHRGDPDHPIAVDYNPTALNPVIPQIQILPGDTIVVPRAGIVYVLGNVMHSGGYLLDGRRTLSVETVMALAGGGGHAAALSRVHIVRTLDDGRKEDIVVAVDRIYKGRAPDVALKDGDILYVPTSNARLAAEQAISSALSIGTNIAIYRTAYQ
ncbi:MAG: polysaccharide biosynthesis/export family protein [Terracidiphilus sp.]|jgi:polysaccharide export outer membrane protein